METPNRRSSYANTCAKIAKNKLKDQDLKKPKQKLKVKNIRDLMRHESVLTEITEPNMIERAESSKIEEADKENRIESNKWNKIEKIVPSKIIRTESNKMIRVYPSEIAAAESNRIENDEWNKSKKIIPIKIIRIEYTIKRAEYKIEYNLKNQKRSKTLN